MFSLTKQVFVTLLSFSRSLATKYVSLNSHQCMIRPFHTDLNPVELKCYSFMINLDKLSGSGNSVDDLSTKICVPDKQRHKYNSIQYANKQK